MLYIQQVFTTNVTTISLMSKPYGQNTPIVLYEDTFPITDISSITEKISGICKRNPVVFDAWRIYACKASGSMGKST